MKYLALVAAFCMSASPALAANPCTGFAAGAGAAGPGPDLSLYHITFEDNFSDFPGVFSDAATSDPTKKWYTNHVVCCGVALGTMASTPSPYLKNPNPPYGLIIRLQQGSNGGWTSGTMSTTAQDGGGFTQEYGWFQAHMRLPGDGHSWPAFWMINDWGQNWDPTKTYGGKQGYENDIIDQFGGGTEIYYQHIAEHLWNPSSTRYHQDYTKLPLGAAVNDGFHKYGVLVTPTEISYYTDGLMVFSSPNPFPAGSNAYMILNQGVFQSYAWLTNPSDMLIADVVACAPN